MFNQDITILQAEIDDAADILTLQKIAYQSEAELYQDNQIQPLVETIDELRLSFQDKTFLKAVIDTRIIGSVRGYEQDGTGYIGKLIVHPEFQNLGIGQKLMAAIEIRFGSVQRYELFTGHKSQRNIYLYQKLGYKIFRREKVSENLELVYMEKKNIAMNSPDF
ncbi:MAG: GNAT family N-acetyltransferase [bacterium]